MRRFVAVSLILFPAMIAGVTTLAESPPPGVAAEKQPAAGGQFTFRDVGDEYGLVPLVAGVRGHAAGWGDVDGDGLLDVYVGSFYLDGVKPNLFFRNTGGKFKLDEQKDLQITSRPTAALFADLDNDGDLEIYVSSMPAGGASKAPAKKGQVLRGCTLFRNDGGGKFTDISAGNGACPPDFGGRSATVLDFDGDGLLDLLVGEDPHAGYNGSSTRSTRLFRNKGNLQFEDASAAAGIPPGIPGYGVAAADLNGDGWPDLFIAANDGGNVLLINDGHGHFREPPGSRKTFAWPAAGGDNMICGVCIGDVNRDGLPDIVIGQHFDSPWKSPAPVRLYLNRGVKEGVPAFEDITERAGLKPLPMKAPHVELQDFDNDGWPDLYISIVKFDVGGRPHPLIYRNAGVRDGVPQFVEDVMAVNDFPTEADRSSKRSGTAFEKFRVEKKIIYMAAAPSGDFDNDGRIDLFMASWFADDRSLLLKNETIGGGWLDVTAEGKSGVNRMDIGAQIRVYPAGKLGNAAAMIGDREISAGYGYASGQPAIAHFGLGAEKAVDVEITLPHGKGVIVRKGVKANQRIVVKQEK